MDPNWFESFFQGVALDLWRAVVTPEQTAAEADFLVRELGIPPRSRVLDVACGNGRLALALAARGYRAAGIDLAAEFIEEARATAGARGLEIEWVHGDMRRLPWNAEFDGAWCFGNSFGYLAHEDTRRFLESLSRALKPGARFVLDTGMAAESLLPRLEKEATYEAGGIRMSIRNEYVAEESRLDTEYTFEREGVKDVRRGSSYVYTVAEIKRVLAACGFCAVALYGSAEGEPYAFGSPGLLLVAAKG